MNHRPTYALAAAGLTATLGLATPATAAGSDPDAKLAGMTFTGDCDRYNSVIALSNGSRALDVLLSRTTAEAGLVIRRNTPSAG